MSVFKSISVSQIPVIRDAMQANVLFLNDLLASDASDSAKCEKFVDYFENRH